VIVPPNSLPPLPLGNGEFSHLFPTPCVFCAYGLIDYVKDAKNKTIRPPTPTTDAATALR
jgi:hypothetical protein